MFAKAFRLFISSTFLDFGEERRLLQEKVFKRLQAHCAKEGYGFRAVDMRWGVNDDAQLNQRTAEICLGEVIEAKGYPAPNLLILIGDRYGWVPLPFAIARDEFAAVRDWLLAQGQSDAVADLDSVYALDENHLAPGGLAAAGKDLIGAYTLRSREDELAELKAPEAWASVEVRLRGALQNAARDLYANGHLRDAELKKYTLSLTEQEIRKGLDRLAASDGPATANSIAWLRTTETTEPPVRALADAVQRALPDGNVLRAELQLGSDGYRDHFVEQITARLIAAISAQIADFKAREEAPDFALQTERAIHNAFAEERLRVFVGRDSNRSAIAAHISGDARYPLVLTGISGSGKTALMAQAAADAKGVVVQRFVGASASSANQRSLLISVIEDLAALGVVSMPPQWDHDENSFANQVRDLLSALDQPVVIFIDALDQLRAPYRSMWLPPQLHSNVKLIVSVLDDEAFAAERVVVQGLRRSLPAEAFVAIEPLSGKDGSEILAGLKREAQSGLTERQEVYILEQFTAAGASPLYLRIAFAIARRWRSADSPRVPSLAGDVTALVGQFLEELSSVHHHEPALVRKTLGLIAAARDGLSESEVVAVLSRDTEVMAAVSSERFGAYTERLPDSVWVRLKRSLAALLVEKGEEGEPLISFFHRQVAEVVRTRFYEPEKTALHTALAAYFDPPAKQAGSNPPWTRRGFIELPFQLFHAGMRARLDALLTDPAWIDRKIGALDGATEIVVDYERFANPDDPVQPLIGRTLRLASVVLARDPKQALPQLHGRLLSAGAPDDLLAALVARMPGGAFYETRPALTPATGAEVARLEGHSHRVSALAVLPDGRLASGSLDHSIRIWDLANFSEDSRLVPGDGRHYQRGVLSLAVLDDGRLAYARQDLLVRLWDTQRCAEPSASVGKFTDKNDLGAQNLPLAVLSDGRFAMGVGHNIHVWDTAAGIETSRIAAGEFVATLAALPDGGLASGCGKTVRLWDIESGIESGRLEGHPEEVTALALLPDGRLASGCGRTKSYNWDNSIRVWDVNDHREVAQLRGHSAMVTALTALPDGSLVSASNDRSIRVWDVMQGEETARLEGHSSWVNSLAILPSGFIASGSQDCTIRIWNHKAGSTKRFAGHKSAIRSISVLDENTIATASGEFDTSIRIWDASSKDEVNRIEGRDGWVYALTKLPGGRFASGTSHAVITIWDTLTGSEIRRLAGHHGDSVTALAALPDGRLASGCEDGGILLWDTDKGTPNARLVDTGVGITALIVLKDGRLVSGSNDGIIRIWDVGRQCVISRLYVRGRGVALAELQDGRIVVGSDGKIRLWDGDTGSSPVALLGGYGPLATLRDGNLVSADDKSVRVWDIASACELAKLSLDSAPTCLASLQDQVIVGDNLGRIHWLEFA